MKCEPCMIPRRIKENVASGRPFGASVRSSPSKTPSPYGGPCPYASQAPHAPVARDDTVGVRTNVVTQRLKNMELLCVRSGSSESIHSATYRMNGKACRICRRRRDRSRQGASVKNMIPPREDMGTLASQE